MLQSELVLIKKEVAKLNAAQNLKHWPLRFPSKYKQTSANEKKEIFPLGKDSNVPVDVQEESIEIIMFDAINRGSFGFLFDLVGDSNTAIVVDVDPDQDLSVSMGSILVKVNGKPLIFENAKSYMDNEEEPSIERRKETTRQQMVKVFQAHGVNIKQKFPFSLTFLQAPIMTGSVMKYSPNSRFKPWSHVFLHIRSGFVGYYLTPEKAHNDTLEHLQKSCFKARSISIKVSPNLSGMLNMDASISAYYRLTEGKNYCFELIYNNKIWRFHAGSHDNLTDWISTLEFAKRFASGQYIRPGDY